MFSLDVGHMLYASLTRRSCRHSSSLIGHERERIPSIESFESLAGYVVCRHEVQLVSLAQEQQTIESSAEQGGTSEDRIKDGPEVGRRGGNHPENFTRRGL